MTRSLSGVEAGSCRSRRRWSAAPSRRTRSSPAARRRRRTGSSSRLRGSSRGRSGPGVEEGRDRRRAAFLVDTWRPWSLRRPARRVSGSRRIQSWISRPSYSSRSSSRGQPDVDDRAAVAGEVVAPSSRRVTAVLGRRPSASTELLNARITRSKRSAQIGRVTSALDERQRACGFSGAGCRPRRAGAVEHVRIEVDGR